MRNIEKNVSREAEGKIAGKTSSHVSKGELEHTQGIAIFETGMTIDFENWGELGKSMYEDYAMQRVAPELERNVTLERRRKQGGRAVSARYANHFVEM